MKRAFGYAWRHEDREWLRANSSAFPFSRSEVAKAPDEIDHRPWLNIEDQGQVGSCAGQAESTCLEVCNFYDTGGEIVALSRMYAYLQGQRHAGLLGRDVGCSISGAVQASREDGICLEKTFPYPGRYVTRIPAAAHEEAAEHKLLRHSDMTSYDDCFAWLATGQGAVHVGCRWVRSLNDTTGVVESLSGGGMGFHAVPLVGYTKRKDRRGRKYLLLPNSWGRGWGADGWGEIAPSVVDQWCARRDNEEVIGVSDLEEYGARKVTTWRGVTG